VGVLLTIAARVPSVSGEQWLTNGGFESGTSPWNIPSGVVTAACDAQEGGGAFGVTSTGTNTVAIRQTIFGPLPPGEYTLTGWRRVREGTAQVGIVLALTGPSGFPTGFTSPEVVPTGGDYTPFSLSTSVPWQPESILVALHVLNSSGAEVCFDSLELNTVAAEPTSTPTLTPTSPPQTEATATPTATSPAGGSPATATSTATV